MADAGWYELRVKVQGRLVFVRMGPEVAGSIPLVHVHGFGVSGSYLLPTARALAHRATTVVPDLPGYGQSAPWGHALGIPSLAWVLLEVLDTLGLQRVVLVGNSMGGPVCLEVAHRAPQRVAGIVLASPAGGMHNQPLARALSCSSPAMWGGKTCGWLLSCFATISIGTVRSGFRLGRRAGLAARRVR
jgi:pimeloyl-ACP methyl ester carboxylesterase